ncbi:hypothetical protein OC846_003110 [Tilletia horrida]|uniref:Nucleoporin Nup188 N-terminal subdomain III domain-containing protein n=1 Tax=Tilletia horrida TaxID=155126 RepID=A0AAN6GQB4_9BASI|nr:hypothetical protein OC845_001994 [Tilletia horrida]KAK0551929.1 hypothetical protein OC846_003110 [Tilletia horrida]KAK0568652.1 hypothetical protein OC861_001729 [Tilletia horrida]
MAAKSAAATSQLAGSSTQLLTYTELAQQLQDPGADLSVEALTEALIARTKQLRNCGDSDSAPSKDAKNTLDGRSSLEDDAGKKVDLSPRIRNLAVDFSHKLDISQTRTALLLAQYVHRAQLSSATLEALSETQQDELYDSLVEFYFEEKLAKMECVQTLFLIAETEGHPFQEGALDTLAKILDDDFGARCVRAFAANTRRQLPVHVREVIDYAAFWATQQLKEQLALLQVAFTFFRNRPAEPEYVNAALVACIETNLGAVQVNRGFFPPQTELLQLSIRMMLILLMASSIDLDTYSTPVELPPAEPAPSSSASPRSRTLADDPALIRKAVEFLDFDDFDYLQGPVMLAWALVFRSIDEALALQREASGRNLVPEHLHDLEDAIEGEHDAPIWQKLSSKALEVESAVFLCLREIAESPLLAALPVHSGLALAPATAFHLRSTLKRIVLASVQLVRPEYQPDFDGIVAVLEATCSIPPRRPSATLQSTRIHPDLASALPKLCLQFWTSDIEERQAGLILDTARRRWPVSFRPLLRLLLALSGIHRQSTTGAFTSADHSDAAAQARSYTISYFVNLSTLTFPLPSNNPIYGAYWRVIRGGSDGSAVYEAVQSIPIFGNHALPAGSQGILTTQEDSVEPVALWTLDEPVSGWIFLRDFLLALAPLDSRPTRSSQALVDQDDIFDQTAAGFSPQLDFYALALASTHETMDDVISDILDLFNVALSSPSTATLLFDHFRQNDESAGDSSLTPNEERSLIPGDRSRSLLTSTSGVRASAPALSRIVMNMLVHVLSGEIAVTRCVMSAYQLLAALVPYESTAIWSVLRSTELLPTHYKTGAVGGRFSSSYHACDRILAACIRSGRYGPLLALLDLLAALIAQVQCTHLGLPSDTIESQAGKIADCIQWVFACVWTQFHTWAYQDPMERLLLAERCLSLFEVTLDDPSLRLPESNASALGTGVERLFVAASTADIRAIQPILVLVNGGHALLRHQDQRDKAELAIVTRTLTSTLSFAAVIIERAQQLEDGSSAGKQRPSLMMLAFFESGSIAERLGPGSSFVYDSTASAVMEYALSDVSPLLSVAALQLLQNVVRAAATISARPTEGKADLQLNLLAHLGSTAQVSALRTRMADVLQHPHPVPVQRELWRLLAVISNSQPALASLLLSNGKDLPLRSSAFGYETGQTDTVSTPLLSLAAKEVENWQQRLKTAPRVLEAVLQLLSSTWLQRSNLQSSIDAVSESASLWSALRQLILFKTENPSIRATNITLLDDGSWTTDVHISVSTYGYQVTCKAAALGLFTSEILYRCAASPPTPASQVALNKLPVFKEAIHVAEHSGVVEALSNACTMDLAPAWEDQLSSLFASHGLDISVSGFLRVRPDAPFNQMYGDSFKYDGPLLLDKLEGLAQLGVLPTEALRALLLEVAGVNNDLSASTAQRFLLFGWNHFLDSLTLHHDRLPWQSTAADQERHWLSVFIKCARQVVDDPRLDGYMMDVNRKRVRLLSIVLTAAWGRAEEQNSTVRNDVLNNTVAVVDLCQQLLDEAFSQVQTVSNYESESWTGLHQDLLTLTGLCAAKANSTIGSILHSTEHAQREARIKLAKANEAFRRSTLVSLSAALQYGLKALHKPTELATLMACHEDVALIGAVLIKNASFSHSVNILQQDLYDLRIISLAFELIQRAPVLSPTLPNGAFDVNGQTEVWLFAQALLPILLSLSSHPALSETLILNGVMSTFAAHSLTEALEAGALQPSPSALIPRPLFDCWILIVRTVISLIDNLNSGDGTTSAASRFVEEEVLGFARLYHLQILDAFDLSNSSLGGDSSAMFLVSGRTEQRKDKISPQQLAAIRAAAQLYNAFCRTVTAGDLLAKPNPAMEGLLSALTSKASLLLQQSAYLLQHPLQLKALLHQEGSAPGASHEDALVILRDVAGGIVSAFFTLTGPELLFMTALPAAPRRLIKASLRTHPSEPASLGTLMDLSSHLTETLRKLKDAPASAGPAPFRAAQLAGTLEQTLALSIAQLVILFSGASSSTGAVGRRSAIAAPDIGETDDVKRDAEAIRRELEAGLARDLIGAIRDARSATSTVLGKAAAAESTRIFDVLTQFTETRLATFLQEG